MGKRGPRSANRALLVSTAYPIYCDFWAMAKGERRIVSVKQEGNATFARGAKIPAEPGTLIALFEAVTDKEIQAACRNSAWMAKQPASHLTRCLPLFAKQFLDAKSDRHYPRSDRHSSVRKKFWFAARALAGAMYGLSPRRTMNIIGAGLPEEIFENLYYPSP
jgi:hypothetical protein